MRCAYIWRQRLSILSKACTAKVRQIRNCRPVLRYQIEHPLTYAHIDTIRALYGVRIEVVNGGDVPTLVRKYKRFPSDAARFCTDHLKFKQPSVITKLWPNLKARALRSGMGCTAESHQRAERYAGVICDEVMPPHLLCRLSTLLTLKRWA